MSTLESSIGDATAENLSTPARPSFSCEKSRDGHATDSRTTPDAYLPVQETHYFQTNFEELMQLGAGRYVLIVGQRRIDFFDTLEAAADYSSQHHAGKIVLIKKVEPGEPTHTLGGAAIAPMDGGGRSD